MNYSVNKITTLADCDALINLANGERKDLEFKKLQQERAYESVASGSEGVDGEIAAVSSEITGVEMAIANMTDGPIKKEFESRLVKLRHKLYLLEERRERYGVLALVEKEYEINSIEQQLAENVAYLAALTNRKAEI